MGLGALGWFEVCFDWVELWVFKGLAVVGVLVGVVGVFGSGWLAEFGVSCLVGPGVYGR